MIVAITGTPATGKTSAARELSKITGWPLVSLNDLAEKKGLYAGSDRKRKCRIVDIRAIRREIGKTGGNLIIESHYAHEIKSDLVIVLRANPSEIRKRGSRKGWPKEKTEENVQAEIMEEILAEARRSGATVREVDTTGKSPRQSAEEIGEIMQSEGLCIVRDLKIPEHMREKLREPLGVLFKDMEKAARYLRGTEIISVGDHVSYSLYEMGVKPRFFVTDGLVRRKPFEKKIEFDYLKIGAKNPAGYITRDLWMAVERALKSGRPVRIVVDGEEDMAALPCMILAGKGMSVVYGLFDRGVCAIKSGPDMRRKGVELLRGIASHQ